jgi:hypothetical protein
MLPSSRCLNHADLPPPPPQGAALHNLVLQPLLSSIVTAALHNLVLQPLLSSIVTAALHNLVLQPLLFLIGDGSPSKPGSSTPTVLNR